MNIIKHLLAVMILMSAVGAADDMLAVVDLRGSAYIPEQVPIDPDTADTVLISEPVPIHYTGAAISAFIPGGGQFYQRRYFMGGLLLAAEATTIGVSIYWWDEANWRNWEVDQLRDRSEQFRVLGEESDDIATGDNSMYWSGLYTVLADRREFEAHQARYTAYSAITWAAGIHLFSFLNALEAGGAAPRGEVRDPTRAGLLATVPFLSLGQFYNKRPGKAGMITMAQVSLMTMAYGHQRLMGMASDRYNEMRDTTSARHPYSAEYLGYWRHQYDRNFSQRNTYLWASLFTYLYSLFDAIVDAHLSDFDERIRIGTDLAIGIDGLPRYGVRLSLTY
ncbi:MAG: DUF5683 domain-containing protein [Chitinispirillales bacterium]|jgi:TM2 domain-containing membrane protein YozV|nr:DUF5683 domain-containing protein [Chitinispirillales bacterium]